MGGLAEYKEPVLPEQPSGIWGKRSTISPTEGKELVQISPKIPSVGEVGINTLDFIFENLRRTNYASANTFDKLYDNLSLLKAEGDKGVGIPGLLQTLKKGDWNLAASAWKGFTLEEKKTFSDLAEKAGIPFPKATGFVGDVALDPITYLPASWFRTAFKTMGIGKIGKTIEKTPLGKAFIPGAGLPEEYYTSKLFAKYSLSNDEKKIIDEIYELRKGLGKDAREHLTKIRSLGYDPVATAKEIDALVDEGIITVKDIYKLNRIADRFDTLGQQAVNEGLISKEAFGTWKDSYWPGLAKEKIKLGSPDVVPNFFEKASKGGFYTKQKHFANIDDLDDYLKSIGIKEGAERDILKLLTYREVTQARFLAKKYFVDETLNKFGQKVSANIKEIPEGMGLYMPKGAIRIFGKEYIDPNVVFQIIENLPPEQALVAVNENIKNIGALTKKVPAYLLPKEIADDLNKMNKFFIGDESTNFFLRHIIDKPLSVWKSMATAYRLPFHLRNFSSNMFLMFEGDVNPAMIPIRLSEAGSIQSGAVKELMVGTTKVNKELLNKFGILGGHGWIGEQSSGRFVDEIDSILKYGRAKNFNPMQYPKEFGSFIESNSRIGLFIDQLHKGKTVEEAALHVKKYLFNYDELTQFERNVMKRIIPFYTWWKKNIPLQIEMLATKPGKLSTAAKGLDALSGEETLGEKKARPEYFDDMGYRKTPDFLNLRDDKGNPIYFYLDMPYNDLLMFDTDIKKVFGQLYGGLSPLKLPLEIMMNVKAFPKVAQIEKFRGQRVPAPSYIGMLSEQLSKVPMGKQLINQMGIEPIIDKNTGLKILGMSALWKYGIETSFPVLSEMGKMYPQPIKLEEENAPWRRWSYVLGVKIIPLNIEMQNKMKQIEKMGKSNEFMKRLQNIGRTPTSQELNDFMKEMNK